MKLFARLSSKTPPALPTLQGRIAILNTASADLILDAALHAEEEPLRIAAIYKLPDGNVLRTLAGLSAISEVASIASLANVERAAQTRMAQLVDAGSIDFMALRDQAQDRLAMFAVAALCKDAGRLPQALDLIRDPEQVARLIVEGPSSRLRRMAAELVHDPVQLRKLLPQVRGKDKNVYKILKQKCDALNAEERKTEEIKNEITALCASLEWHAHRTYDSFYTAEFERLKSRWHSQSMPPSTDVAQLATQAIERCTEVIQAHLRQVAQQVAADAATQAARELQQREHRAAEAAAAARAEAQARLQQEAAAIREAEANQRLESRAAEQQFFRQIGSLIRMANAALRDGGTQRAAGLRSSIEQKLAAAATLPTHLSRQLQQLDEKLNELKQWKDYAVAPKRLELIAEMEGLIGSTQEPKVLADRIKSLQQDWRTISKGIVSVAPQEWERFQRASQAAYQPCREYFEAQAKLRQLNLDKRAALLKRLLTFEETQDAENPDWRLLASVLSEAPQEWRRYFPVDRSAGRTVQEAFDDSMGRLQSKLNAWHERNVADKQSLIKRARHLLTQEDSREAIEAVKRLQILWKETGPAPGAQSQALWNEFREVCDSVYQKRQQAYAEYNSGLEGNKVKAVALCEEVERIAALSGVPLREAATKISEWRVAYDALDEMPRTEARGLRDRFERAIDLCRARLLQQQARDTEHSFANLFEAAKGIRAYEWAVLRSAEPAAREMLKQAAERFIEGVEQWPKAGLKTLKEALASADSIADDCETRERALRMLCVRCEIHSETSTPAEDEVLRREYQVQRLMQGMGRGIGASDGDWDTMALEWIRIGAVEPDLYESLRQRFMRCRQNRPAGGPQPTTSQVVDSASARNSRDERSGRTQRHGREGSKAANRR